MEESFNLYGDKVIKTTGNHGFDIAIQRMDELDDEALLYAIREREHGGYAIDIGSGIGIQGLRFATLGFKTMLIDWLPIETTILGLVGIERFLRISYLMKDARKLDGNDLQDDIAICFSQRFIHYLRFQEAVDLLSLVRSKMNKKSKLFLSASGLFSELGSDYSGREQNITNRFALLTNDMAHKHGIQEPVCLYSEDDLVTLGRKSSFIVDRVYSSPFGNIKEVFSPT